MRVNTRDSFAYYCVYPVVTSYNLSTKKRGYRTKSVCKNFKRLKAVYWWCYMHSPRPLSISDILNCMPTDFPTYWD